MTIQDGNQPAAQEIKATIDPVAVAQIVREMQKKDADAAKPSRFQSKIQSLLSSGAVDKDNLKEIQELVEAKAADLEDGLKGQSGQSDGQSMQSRYNEAVADALEKYVDGDEQLEEVVDLLQHKALGKLGKDSDVMAKFNSGQVDKRKVNSTVKEIVEEFSKKVLKRDKSAKGPTINQGVQGAVANSAIENSSSAGSIEEIVEPHRREAYHKLNALFKRNKMSPQDAHKKAFEAATRPYKKAGSAA